MTTRETSRWPRIRSRKNGVHTVKGWYTVQWRFAILHRIAGSLIRLVGVVLLLMAFLPLMGTLFNLVPEGTIWFFFANKLAHLRQWPLFKLQELAPEYSEQLWLHPTAPFSWAYLVLGVVMYRMTFLFAGPAARIIGLLLPPLIKRPVKVRIDEQCVRFWLKGIPRRFDRQPGVRVQFQSEQSLQPVHPMSGQSPSSTTVMRYGHRRIVLAGSMHQRDAERLALGLSHARDLADGISAMPGQGSMPPGFAMPMGF